METNRQSNNEHRLEELRRILNHERTLAMERVRELRHEQEEEALSPPADEMDAARSMADLETHASLIERAEERLKGIDFAFNRMNEGRYGICAQCGDEIALERLVVLPFAAYCLDCQQERNHQTRAYKPWIDEPFIHQWDLPEEMREPTEASHDEAIPLAPEQISVPTARRRATKTKSPRGSKPKHKIPKNT
jgi:DnaK suppressor protein